MTKQTLKSRKRKPPRRCPECGVKEKVDAHGYTNIAPFLGYCMDCIVRAAKEIRQ